MNLKKLERYLRVNLLGPGPSSYKKRIYRAAVSQMMGNTALRAFWLRDAPTGLTFNNSTLCPHCIYMFCMCLKTESCATYIVN
jgi:hypothetical protein